MSKHGKKKNTFTKNNILSKLKNKFGNKIFTVKEAAKHKVSPQLLSHYVKKNQLKRLSHGVYIFEENIGFDSHSLIKEKLTFIPHAIVGLESALKIYGLTDEAPEAIHLIVPLSNVPKRRLEDVQLHRMKDDIYKKHVKSIEGIPVSSLERTIIDLLRSGYSIPFVLSVIEDSRKKKLPFHIGKIKKMAPAYRVKGKVSRLLEVM